MKKIYLILAMILMFSSLAILAGCQNKTVENVADKELPTFEQLIAINSYDEVFKTHKNIHINNLCKYSDSSKNIVEDAILMPGNGKVEYHMLAINAETKEVIQDASRIGDAWYYYDIDEGTNAILEVGVSFVCEVSLPDFFYECKPMGKAYIDGDYIVHHAYSIFNNYDDIDAIRYDYTYCFNKETYLLEKVNMMRYDNNHNVVEENVSVFKYDVNASDIFESTIYDRMHSAENRIDVEIIADYNTENEKKYNLVATTDSILYAAVLNDVTYLTYSDPECQNPVTDLSVYEGLKSVSLYATELVFDDEVRYTVTEEEWNAWTTYKNYTIEQYYGDIEHFVIKYTDNAIEFEKGQIILFEGDKQYSIRETENGYVASDATGLEFTQGELLGGGYVYDEFVYDEELCAYVLDLVAEMGMYWEVKFEDGIPVSIIYNEFEENGEVFAIISYYTNVGTTVIDIPEYDFEEEVEDTTCYTATEEEWNIALNAGNYSGNIVTFDEGELLEYSYKYANKAIEFAGMIVVFEGDKIYQLQELEGVWYATGLEEGLGIPTMVPQGLNFSDYEYNEEKKLYVPKVKTGAELYYSFVFAEGALVQVLLQSTLDESNPEYYELISFNIDEIGTVVIEIPEYTIVN